MRRNAMLVVTTVRSPLRLRRAMVVHWAIGRGGTTMCVRTVGADLRDGKRNRQGIGRQHRPHRDQSRHVGAHGHAYALTCGVTSRGAPHGD